MTQNPVTEFLNPEVTITRSGFRRKPIVPGHDRAASTALLGNPKGKLTRGLRKTLHYFRSYIWVPIEPVEATPAPVKFARRLTALKMSQLIRQQKKFARESSTAKHLLDKLMPGFRSAMQARHDEHLNCFKQVTAEIKARLLAAQGKLAEATE